PEFNGSADPEVYLEWERKIDRMFDFKDLDDEKRCKYAILKLSKSASLWYEGLKARSSVFKTGPDRPVEPVGPGTGDQPVWFSSWIGHAIEPVKTG
ncbi:hypothetical protein L195_g043770, partial [Trifolium pratense]